MGAEGSASSSLNRETMAANLAITTLTIVVWGTIAVAKGDVAMESAVDHPIDDLDLNAATAALKLGKTSSRGSDFSSTIVTTMFVFLIVGSLAAAVAILLKYHASYVAACYTKLYTQARGAMGQFLFYALTALSKSPY